MTDKINTFTTERLSFYQRFSLTLQLVSFSIIVCVVIMFFSKYDMIKLFLALGIIYLFITLLVSIHRSVTYIYEIQIDANKISVLGQHYNKNWITEIEIENLDIFIRKKYTRVSCYYYLVIKSHDNRKFVVNKLFNWNYFILYKLYEEFKKAKSEKINFEEKYLLEGIEKKAKDEFQWRN